MAIPIGTLGTIPTLTIAGRVYTDLTNLIQLWAYVNASKFTTFRKHNGSAGYQVTTGKTLTLSSAKMSVLTAGGVILHYADTDVGLNSASAGTNAVYSTGDSAQGFLAYTGSVTSNNLLEANTNFQIPSQKFPGLNQSSGSGQVGVMVFGYEA